MAKEKTVYFCKECGFESPKWLGQCPGCKAWNSFVEEPVAKTVKGVSPVTVSGGIRIKKPSLIQDISLQDEPRITTGIREMDRVLGGGIVASSLVLVGGDPGIGKSTLLLQVCRNLSSD